MKQTPERALVDNFVSNSHVHGHLAAFEVSVNSLEHPSDQRETATSTQPCSNACIENLKTRAPVDRDDVWASVPAVSPLLRGMKDSTAKTQLAMLLAALRAQEFALKL